MIGKLEFFNLRLIDTASASTHLLQSALPSNYKGQRRVQWLSNNNEQVEIPSKEWIQKLWKWLATQQSNNTGNKTVVLALADWPIIPTTTGFLLAPEPLQTSILIALLPSSRSVDSSLLPVLNKLGCEILDSTRTSYSSSAAGEVQLFAHSADGAGVLRGLVNSYKQSTASKSMEEWFGNVLPAEREQLRTFLLQQRWFTAAAQKNNLINEELIRFLSEMPIFPKAMSLPLAMLPQEKGDISTLKSYFTDVSSQQRYMIPHDLHAALSSCEALLHHPSLLRSCGREADGILLDRLGVKQLTKAEFYKKYVLTALPLLPLPVAQTVSIQLLRELPVLHQADPTLVVLLRDTPLVTTVDGTAVTVASKLYDPRNRDLYLLLDPGQNFPAGEYGPVLDQLKMLGMRTTAGRDTILQAAKDIATAQQQQLPSSSEEIAPAAAAAVSSRGKALLAYIDMEASRLNQPLPANSSSTTTIGEDGGGFNLDSVFSKVASFLGGDGSSSSSATKSGSGGSGGSKEGADGSSSKNEKNEKEVEEFWKELKSLAWCPVQCTPPVPGLPWCRTSSSTTTGNSTNINTNNTRVVVAAPREMRPRAETWLVCSQRLIIDGEPRSQVLLGKMGWNTPLDCQVLAQHLAALGSAFTPPIGVYSNTATTDSEKVTFSQALQQQLAEIVPQLYRTLATLSPYNLTKVRTILGNTTPCIWIGDGFAPVGKVAMKGPLNLSSAGIYVIPLELAPFKDLLLALGVSASFSAEQYIGVLASMHQELANNSSSSTEKPSLSRASSKALSSTQLEQALSIAAALADMHIPAASTLYLPDEHAVLRDTSELMYNDAPWTSHSAEDNFYFIHPVISNDVAERLGVTSLQRCLLVHNADAFPMALTGAAVEAFGQSEALTTRLRHILEAYPDGSGVLMELLQNADDAGATTARFLLDRSEWGTDRVMGSKMSSWQGPALMAWNDAIFSPSDVQNIARIGQDTKLSRPDATGRFGLGFNSVFHFSDLPSFVSGDLLVMFDPHASWLPGVTLAQPGIKIKFPSSPLINHFPDSFQPYQVFGCDMHQRYNGTLFRFPLRTEELAPLSEIKPQAYRAEDVWKLFENFKSQAAHALLFLKSLKMVELWVRDNAESEPQKMFSAELGPVVSCDQQQQHPQAAIKAFVSGKDAFYQQLKATSDNNLPNTCTTVDVKLQNTQQEQENKQQRWLVCNLLAGGAAKQLALQGAAAHGSNAAMPRGWVPWAGVAAPIRLLDSKIQGGTEQQQQLEPSFQGRGFCFLPLPTLTQLPVHVNGLFELSSNRRDLWHGRDLSSGAGKIRADWNSALLADGVAVGYVRLLVAATKIENFDLAAYYALWPQKTNVPEPWNEAVDAVYRLVVDQPVLWSAAGQQSGMWVAPSTAIFSSSFSSSLEKRMALMLLNEGLPVLDTCIPDAIVENLLKYHPQLSQNNILTPSFLRRQLGEKGRLPVSAEKEPGAHAACLQYCLLDSPWDGGSVEGLKDLMGVPLLPLADASLGFLLETTAGVRPLLLPMMKVMTGSEQQECVDLFKSKLAGRLVSLDSDPTTAGSKAEEQEQQQQQLREKLGQLALSNLVNLRVLDAACIAEEVLPVYLPASWYNKLCVTINSTTTTSSSTSENSLEIEDVSVEWVLKLWKILAAAENSIVSSTNTHFTTESTTKGLESLSKWPLIPAEKQKSLVLAAPTPFSGLLEEGSFTEAAMSALSKLGCAFISLQTSTKLPEMVKKSQCIHPATGLGVLNALRHVVVSAAKREEESDEQVIAEMLLDEEKDALRAFLLQPRWFEEEKTPILQEKLIVQLRALPIYRCCSRNSFSTSSVLFSDLVDGEKYLVPDGFNEYAALSSNFIYASSAGEAHVLVEVMFFCLFN